MPAEFKPGQVRDGVELALLQAGDEGATPTEVGEFVTDLFGQPVPPSSIRSSLQKSESVEKIERGLYRLANAERLPVVERCNESHLGNLIFEHGGARLYQADSLEWLTNQPANSIHGVVTDPPYGLAEYKPKQLRKLRAGHGGTWRIPPSFDGSTRSPLPRFTTLTPEELRELEAFFKTLGERLLPVLVPGAHVLVAANPLVSHLVSYALDQAGLERRGEIVRLVTTMRGGDRPKNAHDEFSDVSVMPRSNWEPWLLFRKPMEGTAAQNLRKWGTGGLRRISDVQPFGDVIQSAPTRPTERALASHPSLKPQAFLRQVVRAILPLGQGVVLDPFAGSGSTLAAAEAIGYQSIGVELDIEFAEMAQEAIPALSQFGTIEQLPLAC